MHYKKDRVVCVVKLRLDFFCLSNGLENLLRDILSSEITTRIVSSGGFSFIISASSEIDVGILCGNNSHFFKFTFNSSREISQQEVQNEIECENRLQ